MLAVFLFGRFESLPIISTPVPALPQHPLIQAYFNQNPADAYTDPYRHIHRPGDNLEQIIAEQIQAARRSVDVAVQELRSPLIAQALRDRTQAGLSVRVILENNYSRPISSFTPQEIRTLDARQQERYRENLQLIDRNSDGQLSEAEINEYDALQVIRNAGIPWLDDTADGSAGSGLMHHKFVTLDGQKVLVTSANFTLSDLHGDFSHPESRGNPNALVILESAPLASHFTHEFNLMWGDGPGGQPNSLFGLQKPYRPPQRLTLGDAQIQVQFSPTSRTQPWIESVNGLIGQTLQQAQHTVELALFVFSEQPLSNILKAQHQQGVQIRALIDAQFAFRYYSEALDMLGVALSRTRPETGEPCEFDPNNRPWSQPLSSVGVPQLPRGDLLHHKYGVVDGITVITGSQNWSEAANLRNDETLLILSDPTVAAHFHREFEHLYAKSRLGLPATVQDRLEIQAESCSQVETSHQRGAERSGLEETKRGENSFRNLDDSRLNLNTATAADLEQLSGIGPALAQRIIETRQQAPFTSAADLERVPGIGPKLREQLQDQVRW
nr:phospholipase D-like domain-containing protein [Petrachloros mirabilis]